MALGTITQLAIDPHTSQTVPVAQGDLKKTVCTVVGESSYATGGTALSASQLGLNVLTYAKVTQITGSASNNGAVAASYNNSTGKLQMWASSGTSPVGLVEVGSAVNVSGITALVEAYGY